MDCVVVVVIALVVYLLVAEDKRVGDVVVLLVVLACFSYWPTLFGVLDCTTSFSFRLNSFKFTGFGSVFMLFFPGVPSVS